MEHQYRVLAGDMRNYKQHMPGKHAAPDRDAKAAIYGECLQGICGTINKKEERANEL